MKTQLINLDQSFLDATKLMLASTKGFKWNRLFALSGITTDRVNYYLTLLLKQIFSDNFSGSDAETGMVLIFLKSYFLSTAALLRNNMITDLFGKLRKDNAQVIELDAERNYNYQEAA